MKIARPATQSGHPALASPVTPLALAVTLLLYAPPVVAQGGGAEEVTLLLTFGHGASDDESWDGSVAVAGGEILRLESRDFPAEDPLTRIPRVGEIIGPDSWRVTNRRDDMPGFQRVNYLEMNAYEPISTMFFTVSLYLTVRGGESARVTVTTVQGDFAFHLGEIGGGRRTFLNGRASVAWTPSVKRLSDEGYEDDEPCVATLGDGSLAVAWIAYRERGDQVRLRIGRGGEWSPPEVVTTEAGDLFRCSAAVDGDGGLWIFWSRRQGEQWHLWGRKRRAGGGWSDLLRLTAQGSNTFHRAAAAGGDVVLVWQSFRTLAGAVQSDIYLRRHSDGSWTPETKVSSDAANDWEPAVAGPADGTAFVVWDTYASGNYDIRFRRASRRGLDAIESLTSSPRFEAHASVAVDGEGRPWVAWDESGANWGKDQGFLINPPMATPLHQERTLRLARRDGGRWLELTSELPDFYLYELHANTESPRIAFDGDGVLTLVFRHWRRRLERFRGSPLGWESFLTRFDGESWTWPVPLPHSRGSIEKHAATAPGSGGHLWAAWMSDDREFSDMLPRNAEVYVADLGTLPGASPPRSSHLTELVDPIVEEVPIHADEAGDVRRIRDYRIEVGGNTYQIYRGDLHRHSDVSQDFKYDGSLIELYRYAVDAAAFDFLATTDHQSGYDQEFTWWQSQKLADLFHLPGTFVPLFGYERSLPYPNGHRNVLFAHRGVRTLPIPEAERRGELGAASLFEHLRANDGISIPHSSGTDQGTDWRDDDPLVEPVIEIYQGYRASYEYLGAPRAASRQKLLAQKSGFQPSGYWWNALAKGLRLGVIASSDHWSTHISYACVVAESLDREALVEALKKRHTYGATDNIVLDFQAELDGTSYLMGDVIRAREAPRLRLRAIGTDRIKQLVLVKDGQLIYDRRPNTREVDLEFLDRHFEPKQSYYYVRVLQNDGQLAWSSPIWVQEP